MQESHLMVFICLRPNMASGRRLVIKRSRVRIQAPETGSTFLHNNWSNFIFVFLKRPKMNEKEAGDGRLKTLTEHDFTISESYFKR